MPCCPSSLPRCRTCWASVRCPWCSWRESPLGRLLRDYPRRRPGCSPLEGGDQPGVTEGALLATGVPTAHHGIQELEGRTAEGEEALEGRGRQAVGDPA